MGNDSWATWMRIIVVVIGYMRRDKGEEMSEAWKDRWGPNVKNLACLKFLEYYS